MLTAAVRRGASSSQPWCAGMADASKGSSLLLTLGEVYPMCAFSRLMDCVCGWSMLVVIPVLNIGNVFSFYHLPNGLSNGKRNS